MENRTLTAQAQPPGELFRDHVGVANSSHSEVESIRTLSGTHVDDVSHKALQSVIGRHGWDIAAVIAARAGLN